MNHTLLGAMVALSGLGALECLRRPSRVGARERARSVALGTSLVVFGLAVGLTFWPDALGTASSHGLLGRSGDSTPSLLLLAGSTPLLLLGAPKDVLDASLSAALLGLQAASVALLGSSHVAGLALAWTAAGVLPMWLGARTDPRWNRAAWLYLVGSTLPALLGFGAWVAFGQKAGLEHPWVLGSYRSESLAPGQQALVLGLLTASVLMRMGVTPFQSWLLVLLGRGPLPLAAALASPLLGMTFLLRTALPLLPEGRAILAPAIALTGLGSVVYGAVLALPQRSLRRGMAAVLISQAGFVTLGLATASELSTTGALVQSAAIHLSGLATLVLLGALEARVGYVEAGRISGVVKTAPRMTAAFFLAAIASAGLPGTLTFVGEDLLLEGVLHDHGFRAFALLLAAALNGFTVLRMGAQVFLGSPASDATPAPDLLPREALAVGSLLAATLVLGLQPGPLLPRGTEAPHGSAPQPPVSQEPGQSR